MQTTSIDQIREFARTISTREAITPAVLHLMAQGQTPTGHAVYKLLGQGSQTTINDQIKLTYQSLSNLLVPIINSSPYADDGPQRPELMVLFAQFIALFDQATAKAGNHWRDERAELERQLSDCKLVIEHHQESINILTLECQAQQQARQEAILRFQDAATEITSLRRELADMKEIAHRQADRIEHLEQAIKAANAAHEQAAAEAFEDKRQLTMQLVEQQATASATQSFLESKSAEFQSAASIAQRALDDARQAQSELKTNLMLEVQKATQRGDDLARHCKVMEGRENELNARLSELDTKLSTARAEALAASSEATTLSKENALLKRLSDSLQASLERALTKAATQS